MSLLAMVTEAAALEARMFQDTRWVARLCEVASKGGATHVLAGSRVGERAVGALLLAANGQLRPWTPGVDGTVMLLDGPAASDVALHAPARRLAALAVQFFGVVIATVPFEPRLSMVQRIDIEPARQLALA